MTINEPSKNIAIIQYNAGNIRSVLFALERLGIQAMVTDSHEQIKEASHVIFPGVGEASSAMTYLKERGLDKLIISLRQPFLGICLGMQLMCKYSEEGDTRCLGIFDANVSLFKGEQKVPQMGWNTISNLKTSLFNGIDENSWQYFVHSYAADLGEHTIAITDYIVPFSAALHRDNFYGVQFHPEKSGEAGARILENFIQL
ncbi:MAG: imidazole glycerol phosphate synthase subunit HisH [Bacteroidia bacterium]|nr:imidazole glycerol phosphate synthase subunit HisH [Bacteroidia bacterium]MCC6767927.1 imidazole glycerol phosphate synthase subunit HisH [Bacteroidia bacterium]